MERLSTTGPVNRWPCRARTAPVQDPRQCKSVPLQCPSPGLGKLLARPATVLQPLLRCGASRLLSRLSNTILSVHLSSSFLPVDRKKPPGWAASTCLLAFTIGLHSPAPSQPPTAPAKQEHNNDDNKQTWRSMAGPGIPPNGNLEHLAKVHFTAVLFSPSDTEISRAAPLGGSGLRR